MATKTFCDECKTESFDLDTSHPHMHNLSLPLGWARIERSVKLDLPKAPRGPFGAPAGMHGHSGADEDVVDAEFRHLNPPLTAGEKAFFEAQRLEHVAYLKEMEKRGQPSQHIVICGQCAEKRLGGLDFKPLARGYHGPVLGGPVYVES